MHKRQWGWLLFELNKIKLTERMLGQKGIFREFLPQENRTFKEAVTLLLHCFHAAYVEMGKRGVCLYERPGWFLGVLRGHNSELPRVPLLPESVLVI